MQATKITKTSSSGNVIAVYLQCKRCKEIHDMRKMVNACHKCAGSLEFVFEGTYNGKPIPRNDLWTNMDLIPLLDSRNIVALAAGNSSAIALPELSGVLKGAKLFLKLDSETNPTGTFKDREASIILSRCKELGLNNLVFYSTGNTGRAYTHYAAYLGLTSYFFMPKVCQYKNTASIMKHHDNYIILVDDDYPTVGPYAKRFAQANDLNLIAPLHERIECYATVAYEQFQQMPQCEFFVQTVASGMGPVGFYRGHKNLVKFGLEEKANIPRIICVQSSETNLMYRAYTSGKTTIPEDRLAKKSGTMLFEPTLNSTNPANNYPDLYECLNDTNGIITDARPADVINTSHWLLDVLEHRHISLRSDLEKSVLIGFAGLVRLAEEGVFTKGERILLLSTGRGNDASKELLSPNAIIEPTAYDPVDLKRQLDRNSVAK